jgi:hypothetical protein
MSLMLLGYLVVMQQVEILLTNGQYILVQTGGMFTLVVMPEGVERITTAIHLELEPRLVL